MADFRPGQNASSRAKQIKRRRFLKSLGVCVGVPAFQSLLPTVAQASSQAASSTTGAPLRMAFMSVPNGVQQEHWFPVGDAADFTLNKTMEPLESVKQHLQVISGLKHEHATAGPDGAGDHARANATFLTGLRARKTAGKDIHVGVSVDQVAAKSIGHLTRFRSLELTCDEVRQSGSCDSGYACAYQYNLAWSSPSTPVAPEPNPRLAFERLFGSGDASENGKTFSQRKAINQSILDYVMEDSRALSRQLDQHDRRKLDEYLTSVRSVEQQIAKADEFEGPEGFNPRKPMGIPEDFGMHMELMYDLLRLAFQTDSTRVATLLIAYDGSNRSYPTLGISEGHHYMTHNQRNEEFVERIAKIDKYHMKYFAEFLKKMAATEDVDGNTLLDNSMIVYGGAIADGNRHTHHNLPVILAGQGGGNLNPGRYLQLPEMPMSNMFVDMLGFQGIEVDRFGDSTGRIGRL